jgi:hypothetical protein
MRRIVQALAAEIMEAKRGYPVQVVKRQLIFLGIHSQNILGRQPNQTPLSRSSAIMVLQRCPEPP